MNISAPFIASPTDRSECLRSGWSRLIRTMDPGTALTFSDVPPRKTAIAILNAAKRIGIKVVTRKVSGVGLNVYRIE